MKLECKEIFFAYNQSTPLLCGIDLTLEKGLTVLMGPNGCGKSTLLRILSGELIPQKGSVTLAGKELRSYPGRERAKAISCVLQNSVPVLDYTVEEVVTMGRSAHLSVWGSTTRHDEDLIRESMCRFKVDHLAQRPCNTLSGGECQRTMLAAAWANDPEIFLLDEPTSATDAAHTLLILDQLKTCAPEKRILMICHDLTLGANAADRLILMRSGSVLASGTPEKVLTGENLERVYDTSFRILTCPDGMKAILPEKKKM